MVIRLAGVLAHTALTFRSWLAGIMQQRQQVKPVYVQMRISGTLTSFTLKIEGEKKKNFLPKDFGRFVIRRLQLCARHSFVASCSADAAVVPELHSRGSHRDWARSSAALRL